MPNRKLFKIAGLVGITILVSKFFGLLRDLVIAKVYGTSITADAYNFAYLLTGNILVLIGGLGGPFHSATITTLTRIKDNAEEAGSFLFKITSVTFIILAGITVFVLIFKDQIIELILPGVGLEIDYRQKLWQLTSNQLTIMSPLIIISGLLGILCGAANVYGGYFLPSIGPALPSLSIIIFVLMTKNPESGIALAVGTLIGSIFQLLIQTPYILKAALYENLKFALIKKQKAVGDFGYFLGPALLSTTIGQVTVYIDGFFCSGLPEGSWTATIFANRLIQLPLGLLVTSFLVPFFPRFAELAISKNITSLKDTSILVIKTLWFLALPISAYLLLFARPIVEVIFQRGAFSESSTILVSNILIALILSIIAYVARDTLTRVFYSLEDSKTPLFIAGLAIILKVILNLALAKKFQAPGIAFATSIVTVFNFLLLWFLLRKKIGSLGWLKHLRAIFKLTTATILMLICGFIVLNSFGVLFHEFNFALKLTYIVLSFLFCMTIYFGLTLTLRSEEAEVVLREIKRKLNP